MAVGDVRDRRVAADLERRGVRGGGGGRARRDRSRRRLPGESRAAPLGALLRRVTAGSRTLLAGFAPRTWPATAGRSSPPRRSFSSLAAAGGSGRARSRERGRSASTSRGEGLGRARDDRRPRAERPLPGLRAGLRPLAGADGGARAGRGDASRLDGRGDAPNGSRTGRAARSHVPRRLGDGRTQDRRPRPDRRPRAGGARRLDGRARDDPRQRRPRARAHDPHLRARRGAHPPLGRRGDRLGLRSRGRDRGVVDEGGPLLAAVGAPVEAGAR